MSVPSREVCPWCKDTCAMDDIEIWANCGSYMWKDKKEWIQNPTLCAKISAPAYQRGLADVSQLLE